MAETISFATAFTTTNIQITCGTKTSDTHEYPYPDKFPYNITKTGFL